MESAPIAIDGTDGGVLSGAPGMPGREAMARLGSGEEPSGEDDRETRPREHGKAISSQRLSHPKEADTLFWVGTEMTATQGNHHTHTYVSRAFIPCVTPGDRHNKSSNRRIML